MDLVTVHETAAMLRLNPKTIRRYIQSGRLPAVRVGRRVRIERQAVEALATPVVDKQEAETPETDPVYTDLASIKPLTQEEIAERMEAIAALDEIRARIRARNGGKPLSPSWPIIREARKERSKQL